MDILTVSSVQSIIKWMAISGIVLLFSSCDPLYHCDVKDVFSVTNLTDAMLVIEILAYNDPDIEVYDSVHCSAIDTSHRYSLSGITEYWRAARCIVDEKMDEREMCAMSYTQKASALKCPKACIAYEKCIVYNLTDTTRLVSKAWYDSPVRDYCLTSSQYTDEKVALSRCCFNITEEMLAAMTKDYSLIDRFPWYYNR